jgi:hypothetical protein
MYIIGEELFILPNTVSRKYVIVYRCQILAGPCKPDSKNTKLNMSVDGSFLKMSLIILVWPWG